jgi:hypothetical protein
MSRIGGPTLILAILLVLLTGSLLVDAPARRALLPQSLRYVPPDADGVLVTGPLEDLWGGAEPHLRPIFDLSSDRPAPPALRRDAQALRRELEEVCLAIATPSDLGRLGLDRTRGVSVALRGLQAEKLFEVLRQKLGAWDEAELRVALPIVDREAFLRFVLLIASEVRYPQLGLTLTLPAATRGSAGTVTFEGWDAPGVLITDTALDTGAGPRQRIVVSRTGGTVPYSSDQEAQNLALTFHPCTPGPIDRQLDYVVRDATGRVLRTDKVHLRSSTEDAERLAEAEQAYEMRVAQMLAELDELGGTMIEESLGIAVLDETTLAVIKYPDWRGAPEAYETWGSRQQGEATAFRVSQGTLSSAISRLPTAVSRSPSLILGQLAPTGLPSLQNLTVALSLTERNAHLEVGVPLRSTSGGLVDELARAPLSGITQPALASSGFVVRIRDAALPDYLSFAAGAWPDLYQDRLIGGLGKLGEAVDAVREHETVDEMHVAWLGMRGVVPEVVLGMPLTGERANDLVLALQRRYSGENVTSDEGEFADWDVYRDGARYRYLLPPVSDAELEAMTGGQETRRKLRANLYRLCSLYRDGVLWIGLDLQALERLGGRLDRADAGQRTARSDRAKMRLDMKPHLLVRQGALSPDAEISKEVRRQLGLLRGYRTARIELTAGDDADVIILTGTVER